MSGQSSFPVRTVRTVSPDYSNCQSERFGLSKSYVLLLFYARLNREIARMITYNSENVKMPALRRRDTSAWIRRVAASYGKRVGEVGYLFCDDEKILEVNREFLQHDYYTDIITFDYCEGDVLNGDIVISLDTVRSNAEQLGKAYEEELHRVIIHGILHLCGQNDKGPGERKKMEDAENRALAIRNNAQPLPSPVGEG